MLILFKLYALKIACTVFLGILLSTLLVPDRIFWKDEVKEIILPTLSGQMGVLKGHIPLLTGLDTGRARY
jgi:F-type H+-transporting ATPase subunit epsilon